MSGTLTLKRYLTYWLAGTLLTLLVMALAMLVTVDNGRISLTFPQAPAGVTPAESREIVQAILWARFTRVASAALVGAALAASGVLLQALLRNPLADPYVLGISTGASVFVLLWLLAGTSILALLTAGGTLAPLASALLTYGDTLPALIGALISAAAVFSIARASSSDTVEPLTLLLVGVVWSAFAGAVLILLNAMAPHGVRADIMNYLIGHIPDGTSFTEVAIALSVFAVGWIVSIAAAQQMNIASLSDAEAHSMGVRLGRLRVICFVAASAMTAAAIAIGRSIGFVGLISPHVCRMLFGPDQRQLIVTAPFCGAIFLVLADALVQLSRAFLPYHVPVGVITALAGGPFFLLLLRRRKVVAV